MDFRKLTARIKQVFFRTRWESAIVVLDLTVWECNLRFVTPVDRQPWKSRTFWRSKILEQELSRNLAPHSFLFLGLFLVYIQCLMCHWRSASYLRHPQILQKASRTEAVTLQCCFKWPSLSKELHNTCSISPVATEEIGSDYLPTSSVPANSDGIGWCGSPNSFNCSSPSIPRGG